MQSQVQASGDLPKALLLWIKHFPEASHVEAYSDLSDGKIIWSVLGQLNPAHFRGLSPLPGRTTWSSDGWTNILHIDRRVTEYINDACKELPHLMQAHLKELQRASTEGDAFRPETGNSSSYARTSSLVRLLTYVFLAGVYSEESNQRVVSIIQSLGDFHAEILKAEIDRLQTEDDFLGKQAAVPAAAVSSIVSRDPELESEERLITVISRNKELEQQVATLTDQIKSFNEAKTLLQERLADVENRLHQRSKASESKAYAALKEEHERDRDVIADLEGKLAASTESIELLEKKLRSLTSDVAEKQELRDQIQVLKAERNELANSVKANDNLKKKIQSLQEEQRAADGLRARLEEAQAAIEQLEKVRSEFYDLQREHAETMELLSNGEKELFAQRTAKVHLQHELESITAKYSQQLEIHTRQEEQIQELESRLEDLDLVRSSGRLDSEIEAANEAEDSAFAAPASTLALPSGPLTLGVDEKLRKMNDNLLGRLEKLEADFLVLLERKLKLEDWLQEISTDNDTVRLYREQLMRAEELEKKAAEHANRAISQEAQIKNLEQKLQTSLPASDLEAVANAQKSQSDLIHNLQLEVKNHQSLLERALRMLAGQPIPPGDKTRETQIDLLRRQLNLVRQEEPSEAADQKADQFVAQVGNQLCEQAAEIERQKQALSAKDEEIRTLQEALEEAKNRPPLVSDPQDATPVEDEHATFNQFHVKIMTTAWYGLVHRLGQSKSNIHYSRRTDSAKGWLTRQRASVDERPVGSVW